MQLKRINYRTAYAFGVVILVLWLLRGLIVWYASSNLPQLALTLGIPAGLPFLWTVIGFPLLSAVIYAIVIALIILVYNRVARTFPISWEVK